MRERSFCVGYGITTADYADHADKNSDLGFLLQIGIGLAQRTRKNGATLLEGAAPSAPLTIKNKESLAKTAKVAKQEDNREKTRRP